MEQIIGIFYLSLALFISVIFWYILTYYHNSMGSLELLVILFIAAITIYIESVFLFMGRMMLNPEVMSPSWVNEIIGLGRTLIPVFWFLFALEYSDHRWNSPPIIGTTYVYALGVALISVEKLNGTDLGIPQIVVSNQLFITLVGSLILILTATIVLGEFFYKSYYEITPLLYVTIGPIISFSGLLVFLLIEGLPTFDPVWYTISAVALALAVRHNLDAVEADIESEIIHEINELVFYVDGDSIIIDYNEAAANRFPSITNKEMNINDIVGDRTDDRGSNGRKSILSSADGEQTDQITIEQGSESRCYQVSVTKVENIKDRERYLVIMTDVTESERYKTQLEQRNEDLEMFSQTLAHDVMNHTQIVVEYSKLLQNNPEKIESYTPKIISSGESIREIIEATNDVFRAKTSQTDIEKCNLQDIVKEVWSEINSTQATLHIDSTAEIYTDKSKCKLLLQNLFNNAIEHNDDTVEIHIGTNEGGFYVADTGVGIPDEKHDEIFTHGYSGGGSTGMGMSIVKSIIEIHGWNIHIDKEYTNGAKFIISGVEKENNTHVESKETVNSSPL